MSDSKGERERDRDRERERDEPTIQQIWKAQYPAFQGCRRCVQQDHLFCCCLQFSAFIAPAFNNVFCGGLELSASHIMTVIEEKDSVCECVCVCVCE